MIAYIIKRFLQLIPVLFIVSVALFLLLRILPGDPTTGILGLDATDEQRAVLGESLGLNEPIWVQFGQWIGGVVTGNLGESWLASRPVSEILLERLPITAQLVAMSLIFALIVGIPAGVLSALRQRTAVDSAFNAAGVLGLAIPHFFLAVLLILVFAVWLGWLPVSGYVPIVRDPFENMRRMILPALTVGSTVVAVTMRQTRGSLMAVMSEDFVRTARATGLTERKIIAKYALRNAMIPVVTVLALQIGVLISATVTTEKIFALPGMGTLIVDSIFSRDLPLVQGAVLVIVALVLIVNLIADLIYAWIDPRIAY